MGGPQTARFSPQDADRVNWGHVRVMLLTNLRRDFRTLGPPGVHVRPEKFPAIVLVLMQFFLTSLVISVYNFVGPINAPDGLFSAPSHFRSELDEEADPAPLAAPTAPSRVRASDDLTVRPPSESQSQPASGPVQDGDSSGGSMAGKAEQGGQASAPRGTPPPLVTISPTGQQALSIVQQSRVLFDVPTFSFLMFCLSMVMTMLTVIGEFSSVVIHPDDNEILGHRPVSSQSYFVARLLSLGLYVTMLSVALALPPATVGMFIESSSWRFFPAFIFCCVLANLTATGVVLGLYSVLMRNLRGNQLHDLVAYSHIVFLFFIFLGFQLTSQLQGFSAMFLTTDAGIWLQLLPMTWFAWLTTVLTWDQLYTLGPFNYGARINMAATAALLAPLVIIGPLRRLSFDYADYLSRLASSTRGTGSRSLRRSWVEQFFLQVLRPSERAGFFFAWAYIVNDRQFKTRFYPIFATPLAFIAIGLFQGSIGNPFHVSDATLRLAIYALALNGMAGFSIAAAFSLLPFSEHASGSWVFRVAPMKDPVDFINGIKQTFLYVFFLPLSGFLLLFFWVHWQSLIHALAHVLTGWGFTLCIMHVAAATMIREMPFSMPPQRAGPQNRLFASLMQIMFASLVFWIVAYYAYSSPVWTAVLMLSTFAGSVLLERFSNAALRRHLGKKWE